MILPYCKTLQKPQFTIAIPKPYLTSKELVNVLARQTDIKFRALMLAGKGEAIRSDHRKDKHKISLIHTSKLPNESGQS